MSHVWRQPINCLLIRRDPARCRDGVFPETVPRGGSFAAFGRAVGNVAARGRGEPVLACYVAEQFADSHLAERGVRPNVKRKMENVECVERWRQFSVFHFQFYIWATRSGSAARDAAAAAARPLLRV